MHFGKILFNLQFVAVAIMAASVISFLFTAVYYLLLVCVLILSLFTLLADPGFQSLMSGGESLTNVASVLSQSWAITVPTVAALSIASIVCLCFDKNERHTARIVVSSIVCVIALLVLILKLVNSGASA